MRHLLLRLPLAIIVMAFMLPPAAVTAGEMPSVSTAPLVLAEETDPPIEPTDPPVDTESPSVTLSLSEGQSDPTNSASISFAAFFSEPVSGLTQEDVAISGSAGADSATVSHSGDGQNYTINIIGMDTAGSVVIQLPAAAAVDAADNASLASQPVSAAYDAIRPSVNVTAATGQVSPTNNPAINFTLTFSKPVTGLEASDLTVSNAVGGSLALTGSGNLYNVALTAAASGTVALSVVDSAATDAAGNASLLGSGSIALDTTRPIVSARTPAINAVAISRSGNVVITFSEPVSGVSASSVVLRNTAGNEVVPAAISYDAVTRRATINPSSDLAHVRVYQVELTAAIVDAVGNALTATNWRFTTGGTVSFGAGSHTGVRFNSSGAIISSKKITLSRSSSAPASARKYYSGHGIYLYITAGSLAGYWLRETSNSYLPGLQSYAAYIGNISFSVGRYTGRPVTLVTGVVGTSKTVLREVPVSYAANASGIINGISYYRMTTGPLVGLWVRRAATNQAYRDNAVLPSCGYANTLTKFRTYGDWSRTLLDLRYMIPSNYKPGDLAPITNSGARYGSYGVSYVRNFMMPDLKALVTAVRNAGYGQLQINTAFRDYNLQATWWGNYVRNGGSKTYPTTLPPGHSEHQLGTTLDINVYAKPGLNAWMAANAWKYGFVKSYPPGKNAKHCIASEDWHYRYYGRSVASLITKSGLTTREWLWYARH